MSYVCEKSVGPDRTCTFRSGTIILQQPVDRAQMSKLLSTGKTDLLSKFISKKGRPFSAYLVVGPEGKVSFEFEKREKKKSTAKSKAPAVKLDFTGQESLGACPKCGGKVFESEADYLCERSQAESRRCAFKIGKTILQQPVERAQALKILQEGRSDLLKQFISKAGRPFPAYLVLADKGKVGFEFPPKEESSDAEGD
jgi:DNA topoisomerase-3